MKYKHKVKEIIKIIEYQINNNVGYINLHDYTKIYDLNKTQLLSILKVNKLIYRLEDYNNKFKPAP